ncbi:MULTISPECIES: CPBP family intramembrane glutamic endopeptidase [Haloferax]|uniref:CPBP family intramembrane metalloprotease n=1 Tax=Haloferax marinum TaxID=2666143 RepID=A0A6A8G679_9EURY|nr:MULTISPECIES: type II CAAX endopeptidase family protein [Haloferax]KAB1197584.1 CPBP family intramembrane metalloprotease [Haloferax sp. CBA1150]MRW96634.1 CPBP family intramembrane metalloprotease [Haloferax marinum]
MTRRVVGRFLSFIGLAALWAWPFWLLTSVLPDSVDIVAILAGAWGPTVAAVVLTWRASGRDGVRALLSKYLAWRTGLLPAVGVVVSVLATTVAAVWVTSLGGVPPGLPGQSPPLLFLPVVILVNVFLGGPLAEEAGWRGFAHPLLRERVGPGVAGIIVGLGWGLWHAPLFFLPGQGFVVGGTDPLAFIALTISWSVLFGVVTERADWSLLPAVFGHATVNTALGTYGFLAAFYRPAVVVGFAVVAAGVLVVHLASTRLSDSTTPAA